MSQKSISVLLNIRLSTVKRILQNRHLSLAELNGWNERRIASFVERERKVALIKDVIVNSKYPMTASDVQKILSEEHQITLSLTSIRKIAKKKLRLVYKNAYDQAYRFYHDTSLKARIIGASYYVDYLF